MHRVLVAFASREGQTEKVAHHVARQLENRKLVARLIDVRALASAGETEAGADDCDGAIIAGSMHRAKYDQELSNFVMRHGPALRRVPSAFLSVSLSAASHEASELAAIDEIARTFAADCGWSPEHIVQVAGAVHDRKLGFIERQVLHAIVDAHGIERHPSGDTELTDWTAVDAFVADFATEVTARPAGQR